MLTKSNVSIIGKHGSLAAALEKKLIADYHVSSYDKKEYNFLNKDSIVALANKIHSSDIIINCSGTFDKHDAWDSFLINAVAPAYLLEQLTLHKSTAHVIMIGSHSSMWTSWPGISFSRLMYNNTKQTLHSVVTGLSHSECSNLKLSIINCSKFQSSMNNLQGYPVDIVVDQILHVMNSPIPILVEEFSSYK